MPSEAPKSALEAMDAALEPESTNETNEDQGSGTPETAPLADTPVEAAAPAEGTPSEGEGEDDGTDPELSARRAAQAASQPREKGKFAPKTPKEGDDPAAAAAAVAAPKPATAVEPKKADPLTDPLPVGTKAETAARFESLREMTKTTKAALEAAEADRDLLLNSVRDTGATSTQFGEALNLLKDINSQDAAANERAYNQLLESVNLMAQKLGKVPPGVDPLSGHNDLIAEINAGRMTRQIAESVVQTRLEAAALRNRQTEQTQRQQADQQSQQALIQARTQGASAIKMLESTLRAADPNFAAKHAAIMADSGFRAQLAAAHPVNWVNLLQTRYAAQAAPVAAAAPAIPGRQAPAPLRGKAPAGGQQRAPASAMEAMEMALGG